MEGFVSEWIFLFTFVIAFTMIKSSSAVPEVCEDSECMNGGSWNSESCSCVCKIGYMGKYCNDKCADISNLCYPNFGCSGYSTSWCTPGHPYVTDTCFAMCGRCYLKPYSDALFYFSFNEFQFNSTVRDEVNGAASEPLPKGVTLTPGRVMNKLSFRAQDGNTCTVLGNLTGTCLTDPAICSSGLTFAFYLIAQHDHPYNNYSYKSDAYFINTGADVGTGFVVWYDRNMDRFRVRLADGKMRCDVIMTYHMGYDGAELTTNSKSSRHIVVTWSEINGMALYLNGDLKKTDENCTDELRHGNTNNLFYVGCKNRESKLGPYLGSIDEIAVWDRILTQAEMLEITNLNFPNGTTGKCRAPPIATVSHEIEPTTSIASVSTFSTTSTIPLNMRSIEFEAVLQSLSKIEDELNKSDPDVLKVAKLVRKLKESDPYTSLDGEQVKSITDIVSGVMNDVQSPSVLKSWNETSETRVAAAEMVHSFDKIVSHAASRLVDIGTVDGSLSFTRENAEINIKIVNSTDEAISVSGGNNVNGRIMISTDNSRRSSVAVTTTSLRSMQSVLPSRFGNISYHIGTNVVGISAVTNGTGEIALSVEIDFLVEIGDTVVPKCVYQMFENNQSSSEYRIMWSDFGCSLVNSYDVSDDRTVKCRCNHTTNFAVLLQVKEVKLTEKDTRALEIITYIGCTLSILGTTLTILTFIFLRIYTDRALVHVNLAAAILFSQVLLLAGSNVPPHTSGCVAMTVLLFYFYLSSFLWMLIEGIHIYLQVIVVFASETKMKLYYFCGWGLPLIVVAVAGGLFHETIGTHDVCWLSPKDYSIWAFAVPALIIVFINLMILFRVIYVILVLSVTKEDGRVTSVMQAVKASLVLLPVLGTTWIFGVLTFSEETVVFQYLFALTNSLQGFLLFICHCLINTEVREVFYRRKSAWESSYSTQSSRVEPLDKRHTQATRNTSTN